MRLLARLIRVLLPRIARLRFPQSFMLTAGLFLIDLLIPDLLPFLDEFLLGLATLLLGMWTAHKKEHLEEAQEDDQEAIITEARVVESDRTASRTASKDHPSSGQ